MDISLQALARVPIENEILKVRNMLNQVMQKNASQNAAISDYYEQIMVLQWKNSEIFTTDPSLFSVFFGFFSLSAFLFNLRHGMRILLSINWTALANVVALSNKRMEEKHHCPLIRIEGKKNVVALNNKRMEKKRHCPLIRIEERKTALY